MSFPFNAKEIATQHQIGVVHLDTIGASEGLARPNNYALAYEEKGLVIVSGFSLSSKTEASLSHWGQQG